MAAIGSNSDMFTQLQPSKLTNEQMQVSGLITNVFLQSGGLKKGSIQWLDLQHPAGYTTLFASLLAFHMEYFRITKEDFCEEVSGNGKEEFRSQTGRSYKYSYQRSNVHRQVNKVGAIVGTSFRINEIVAKYLFDEVSIPEHVHARQHSSMHLFIGLIHERIQREVRHHKNAYLQGLLGPTMSAAFRPKYLPKDSLNRAVIDRAIKGATQDLAKSTIVGSTIPTRDQLAEEVQNLPVSTATKSEITELLVAELRVSIEDVQNTARLGRELQRAAVLSVIPANEQTAIIEGIKQRYPRSTQPQFQRRVDRAMLEKAVDIRQAAYEKHRENQELSYIDEQVHRTIDSDDEWEIDCPKYVAEEMNVKFEIADGNGKAGRTADGTSRIGGILGDLIGELVEEMAQIYEKRQARQRREARQRQNEFFSSIVYDRAQQCADKALAKPADKEDLSVLFEEAERPAQPQQKQPRHLPSQESLKWVEDLPSGFFVPNESE